MKKDTKLTPPAGRFDLAAHVSKNDLENLRVLHEELNRLKGLADDHNPRTVRAVAKTVAAEHRREPTEENFERLAAATEEDPRAIHTLLRHKKLQVAALEVCWAFFMREASPFLASLYQTAADVCLAAVEEQLAREEEWDADFAKWREWAAYYPVYFEPPKTLTTRLAQKAQELADGARMVVSIERLKARFGDRQPPRLAELLAPLGITADFTPEVGA